MSAGHTNDPSLLELFRQEADAQIGVLTSALLALERDARSTSSLDTCMRAAHSLKGAARIVERFELVRIAHAMEDCFVAAQQGRVTLESRHIDALLEGVDLLSRLASLPASDDLKSADSPASVSAWLSALEVAMAVGRPESTAASIDGSPSLPEPTATSEDARSRDSAVGGGDQGNASDRVLRVTAEHLDRLLGLAGQSLVESRWATTLAASLLRVKRLHRTAAKHLENLRDTLIAHGLDEQVATEIVALQSTLLECGRLSAQQLVDLELFDRRSARLSRRLYDEALASRMRPFADAVHVLPRTVRDLARSLDKSIRVEIVGEGTRVDRDILAQLEAPLGHLVRNAVDHGIEAPDERRAAGKPPDGVVRVEARHHAGSLHVIVSDDGRGVDVDRLRHAVIDRKLIAPDAAAALSDTELLEFLFLPGFTMSRTITDISGRGVGLDVVRDMVKQVHGTVRVWSRPNQGTRFQLQLPVTLSVVRALLVEIAGEPYAFPLASIVRTVKVQRENVESLEGRRHIEVDGAYVGLVTAHQALELGEPPAADVVSIVLVGDTSRTYGIVVDRLLGERELVVQPLAAQFGKLRDIAAGALMEDGAPVLILDTEDLLHSLDKIVATGPLAEIGRAPGDAALHARKRVLVIDDSLTVRETERKLLAARGYDVEVAVDGLDGWNVARSRPFDLVITDIDMPRMDGIELVRLIKQDPRLASLPVMVVSYKDRDEDRRRGLEAGAAYYLTKSSFHDDTLVQAVANLIGEAGA